MDGDTGRPAARQGCTWPLPSATIDIFEDGPQRTSRRAWITASVTPRALPYTAAAYKLNNREARTADAQQHAYTAWELTFADEQPEYLHSAIPPHLR